MRQSTRTSEAARVPRRRAGTVASILLSALLTCLAGRPAVAVPVTAEARVQADAGDVHGASRAAAQRALVEAVRTVVRRHVNPADLLDHAAAVQRTVLDRAPRYVPRYAISDESWDDLEVVVQVDAEVDRERILARLRDAGVPVAELAVKPRLLLVALERTAEVALRPLARSLESGGYQPRTGSRPGEGGGAQVLDEARVGAWARAAGCHLTLAVGSVQVQDQPLPGGASASPSWNGGLWMDPGGEPMRAELSLVGWVADPSGRLPLGSLQVTGEGLGTDLAEANLAAAETAGRRLGYSVLGLLEQSGWVPEGQPAALDVRISGLVDPLLVEEIGAALAAVPEVRGARLLEVSLRQATWRLQVVDSGLDWTSVLATARLPRGQLAWGGSGTLIDTPAQTPSDATASPPLAMLAARWSGP